MYTPSTTDHHPSFSSSLLDHIYRSIDEPHRGHPNPIVYTKTNNEQKLNNGYKTSSHRSFNSSSTSSDCFSSPDTDQSIRGFVSRPKPIRTSFNGYDDEYIKKERNKSMSKSNRMYEFEDLQIKQKHEARSVKMKSQAMKLYCDLKKVRQPISPGSGRLATILNSLFNSKNTKRSSSYDERNDVDRRSKSVSGSKCSSATSFTRRYLSKNDSLSERKLDHNIKKSVSDDCKPRGRSSMYGDELNVHALKFVKETNNDEVRVHTPNAKTHKTEKDLGIFLKNYQKKIECEFDLVKGNYNEIDLKYEDEEDEDDDDAASHTSSDLFELENFAAIGMEKYGDELPVFETTCLNKKLGIGNYGFFM